MVTTQTISWPLLPDDYELPDDPVDNEDHPLLAAALRQPLSLRQEVMTDALVVTNMALCAAIRGEIVCKAPDWMYVRPVRPWNRPEPRRSYTPHTQGPVPQVVMEFLSKTYGEEYSVESTERVGKWYFYEQVIQVPCYVIFRPETSLVEVYKLEAGRYRLQQPDERGLFWIEGLALFVGPWRGTHEGRTGLWLRWWDREGRLLEWSEERAERLAERLRLLGLDPEE